MSKPRKTRSPIYVRLSEERIRQIDELVAGWNYETRQFILRRLRQYDPSPSLLQFFTGRIWRLFVPQEKNFTFLQNPDLLSDWRRRFEVSGSRNAGAAWEKILRRELSWHDYQYLTHLLSRQTVDIYVPPSFLEIFRKLYRAHILKEYTDDPSVPRAPLILIIGSSGSGKSATVKQALEEAVFASEIRPDIDMKAKERNLLANEPFWRTLEDVDPDLALHLHRRRRAERWRRLNRIPVLRHFFRGRIARALSSMEEEGVWVDYAMITPNDYQTAWAGEPGNYLRRVMGDPRRTCIRHLEEAHSAFGRPDQMSSVKGQQNSLVDAANIILDEIAFGRRDCLLIATSDQPDQFDSAIYRRFVERGLVLDIGDLWNDPGNLKEVVRMELRRHNLISGESTGEGDGADGALVETVRRLYPIFRERSLRITPAYVRRLIGSVTALKADFRPEMFDDQFLVRDALQAVARNVYGDLYGKVVGQMDRTIRWDDYIGGIKNEFSEMANNSLYYNVLDEKGVVLAGPPGSGKTFLVRSWLGANREVQDLIVNLNDLADPINPLEGMVENLERVYDIAKMLSPAMVFFDEGDAVAPRRSSQGGSPYDKITNKFLSLIDGESPLSRVFTVLTTNRLDILDPALIRAKRLKVLNVSGHLREEDALAILKKEMSGIPAEEGLLFQEMVRVARTLCETPADFTAFAEKIRSMRFSEMEVLKKLLPVLQGTEEEQRTFVRLNQKVLAGLAEGMQPGTLHALSEQDLLRYLKESTPRLEEVRDSGGYPITRSHLLRARQQMAGSPTRKGKQQLDEFLETELSSEPQVGFVVGVGASDTSGVLLPIASSLVYRVFPEKIVVTGAVSSSAPGTAELDLAVQMTHQSAREALTLVENYLQSLLPAVNVPRLVGEFLDGYSLHHQLLSASYSVGGPSAGFALAINTLSVLLCLPVLNDFGITGAPWTKGARPGEVGSSVIIGGHRKKVEKVLQYLPRMYLPQRNYLDLEPELLESYRLAGREIRGVLSFSALVPEVFFFGEPFQGQLSQFLQNRRDLEIRGDGRGLPDPEEMKGMGQALRCGAEEEIRRRLEVIRAHVARGGGADAGLEALFGPFPRERAQEETG